MVLSRPRAPLELRELPRPSPQAGQVLIQVLACGVCRTDLHIYDGELDQPKLPLVLGHEVVGRVVSVGDRVEGLQEGQRVGVPWLGWTDTTCRYCRRGQENLCDHALFTGYTLDGGYAEFLVADARFCLVLPEGYGDVEAAPLLCAGLIGYRTYRLAGADVEHLGLYGFGAAAHLVAQVAVHEGRKVYAFTRPGDVAGQQFARTLGAEWAGGSDELPPAVLDAALIFAPVGALVPAALQALGNGGVVVCGGIHMSDIPSFAYRLLWEERVVRSVANLTRADGAEFMRVASRAALKVATTAFGLHEGNEALEALRRGAVHGATVLQL
jgi:propanol-preferring alcohol dehydrogenase